MHDMIIIGAGAAGLSAAVYAARFKLNTLVIGELVGGTLVKTHLIENWPGVQSASGLELMKKIEEHAKSYGIEINSAKVIGIEKKGGSFVVKTKDKELETKTLLLATGTERKKLGIPGEKEFENKGVSYCAACDAALFQGKVIALIGGSDSAAKEALLCAEYGEKVYIIYRKEKLRAEPINAERVEKNSKIEVITNANVIEIIGDETVKKIRLDNGKELDVGAVFVEIGAIPLSGLAEKLGVKLNDKGEIIIDAASKTNVPGVFAAGDVTQRAFKQAITGAAEGVTAAFSAYECIGGKC